MVPKKLGKRIDPRENKGEGAPVASASTSTGIIVVFLP